MIFSAFRFYLTFFVVTSSPLLQRAFRLDWFIFLFSSLILPINLLLLMMCTRYPPWLYDIMENFQLEVTFKLRLLMVRCFVYNIDHIIQETVTIFIMSSSILCLNVTDQLKETSLSISPGNLFSIYKTMKRIFWQKDFILCFLLKWKSMEDSVITDTKPKLVLNYCIQHIGKIAFTSCIIKAF